MIDGTENEKPPIDTLNNLLDRYDENQPKADLEIPVHLLSLLKLHVSKATLRSKYIVYIRYIVNIKY